MAGLRYAGYEEAFDNGVHEYEFTTVRCPHCKNDTKIRVKGEDLFRFNQGTSIQQAFPYLTAGQRERLMSGICERCWDDLFKDEDDKDELIALEEDEGDNDPDVIALYEDES